MQPTERPLAASASSRPEGRWWLVAQVSSGLGAALLVVALGRLTIDPIASVEGGAANLRSLWPFWIASAVGWSGLTALAWLLHRSPSRPARVIGPCAVIVAVAALVRVAVVLLHTPALSDDIHRYVFDGHNLALGVNPYRVRPEDRIGADPRWPGEARLLPLINNPEMYTIYLPTSQWAFAGAALVPTGDEPSSDGRVFRSVLVGFELVAVSLLLWILVHGGRNPWWAALYAWHPMAITEIAGSGHQESIGLALLMLAMAVWTRWPLRVAPWSIALAAGALVKPVLLPIAPLLLRGARWTAWCRSMVVGLVVSIVIAAPLLLGGSGEAIANLRETSSRFALKWTHFGSVYEPLLAGIEWLAPQWSNDPQEQLARAICLGLLLAVVVVIWIRARSPWSGAGAIFLAMVLCSPTAHPWYLLWALILVPMSMNGAVWIASLTLPLGYAAWRFTTQDDGTLGWGVPAWLMVLAYLPVYLAVLHQVFRHRK